MCQFVEHLTGSEHCAVRISYSFCVLLMCLLMLCFHYIPY